MNKSGRICILATYYNSSTEGHIITHASLKMMHQHDIYYIHVAALCSHRLIGSLVQIYKTKENL